MSLKLSTFANAIPFPKSLVHFYVKLPGLVQATLKVSATTAPFAKKSEGVIWQHGRPLYLPTNVDQTGEWTCTWVEDISMTGLAALSALERRLRFGTYVEDKIQVFITEPMTGLAPHFYWELGMTWLKSIKPINLDWSKPTEHISYELTFRYNEVKIRQIF